MFEVDWKSFSRGDKVKVSLVTWERIPKDPKPGDMYDTNWRFVFPEWDWNFFSHKDVRIEDIKGSDIVILKADIWGGEKAEKNLELLSELEDEFTMVLIIGEWSKWISWPVHKLIVLHAQLNHPNTNVVICDELTPKYLQYLVDTPVRYFGYPYAIEYVKQFRKEEKKKIVDFRKCGCINRWPSYTLANFLPEDWTARFHILTPEEEVFLASIIKHPNIEIAEPTQTWEEYLAQLSECSIMVAVDTRFTTGRFCLDAAALGIPCVSGNQHSAKTLFPDLVCEPYDVEKQVEVLQKLFNEEYRNEVIKFADKNLEKFSFESSRQRWIEVLSEFGVI